VQDKESYIYNLFTRIAEKYDLINDVMTGSLHRSWKKTLVEHAAQALKDKTNTRILDLCTGTGDIADLWIADSRVSEIIAIDTCAPMLASGYKKLKKKYQGDPPKLKMLEADALELYYPHEHFDAVTISFGLRNVKDADKCLAEIYRVLKPGGYFACLDLGHPSIPFIDWLYKKVFLKMVPTLGASFAKDKDAYQYLIDSLNTWPSQKTLSEAMYDFGFKRSYYKNIMLGAIGLVVAEK
jgi:demethylmenaquinone methyltransferase/2-methoxy-6-polyprenyl-1,4-benzoquinol methylase